ncbi:MAG: hypothetical protein ACKVOE_00985 [Rickettsiales bacterium]
MEDVQNTQRFDQIIPSFATLQQFSFWKGFFAAPFAGLLVGGYMLLVGAPVSTALVAGCVGMVLAMGILFPREKDIGHFYSFAYAAGATKWVFFLLAALIIAMPVMNWLGIH